MRQYSLLDKMVGHLSRVVQTIHGPAPSTGRAIPDTGLDEDIAATDQERLHEARLMRINYTGEVCAQGLYQGQALTARTAQVREKMNECAMEENDHLNWCRGRLKALDNRTSYLDPLWYAGSWVIGATAGIAGDKWSLGFVAETEHQVVAHLRSHLDRLPESAQKSRAVIEQMIIDEGQHATSAENEGAAELPLPIKRAMTMMGKVMTSTVYYV